MNVVTVILNGEIDENVHMKVPNGFIAKDKIFIIFKLVKGLYGLNKLLGAVLPRLIQS